MNLGVIKNWHNTLGTTSWVVMSLVISLASWNHWGGLRSTKLNFYQRSVSKDQEIWRLVTSALLLDKSNLYQAAVILLLVFSYASPLELLLFKKRPMSFLINLFMAAAALHIPGFFVRELRMTSTSEVFVICVATWFGLEFGRSKVDVMGVLDLSAMLVPIYLVAAHFFISGRDLQTLKLDLVGVAIGTVLKMLCIDPMAKERERLKRLEKARLREASK